MAVVQDIEIEQGATFGLSFQWKDSSGVVINIQGYTARMQIRTQTYSETIQCELTTENGRIEVSLDNKFILSLSATITSALVPAVYIYDLEIEKESVVTRLVRGKVTVSKEVTR